MADISPKDEQARSPSYSRATPASIDEAPLNKSEKSPRITLRLTYEELEKLNAEAARTGRSCSDLVRQAINVGVAKGFKSSATPRLAPVRRRAYLPEDPALISVLRMLGVQAELIQQSLEQCRMTGDLVDTTKLLLVLRAIEHAVSRAMPPLWCRWVEEYQAGPPAMTPRQAKTSASQINAPGADPTDTGVPGGGESC